MIGIIHCDAVRGQRAKANKAGEYLTAPFLCVALVDLKTQPKSTIPFLRAGIFDEIDAGDIYATKNLNSTLLSELEPLCHKANLSS